jgi:transcription-repair coupling factor (superfamily II helicase)
MYCEMLADAVKRLKDQPVEAIPTATIDLGFATYIPKNYIPLDRQRMDIYRKIAVARSNEDLRQIEGELDDIYGPAPEEVGLLLEAAELRIKASKLEIKSIVASGADLIFSFRERRHGKAESLLAKGGGKVWTGDGKTAYLRLKESYFEPRTLMSLLRKILGENK